MRLAYQLLKTTCLMWLLAISGQSLAVDSESHDAYDENPIRLPYLREGYVQLYGDKKFASALISPLKKPLTGYFLVTSLDYVKKRCHKRMRGRESMNL